MSFSVWGPLGQSKPAAWVILHTFAFNPGVDQGVSTVSQQLLSSPAKYKQSIKFLYRVRRSEVTGRQGASLKAEVNRFQSYWNDSPSSAWQLIILRATWPQRTTPVVTADLRDTYCPLKVLTVRFGLLYVKTLPTSIQAENNKTRKIRM